MLVVYVLRDDDKIFVVFFVMIRRPPRSTLERSSAASDVYKRQRQGNDHRLEGLGHFEEDFPQFAAVYPVAFAWHWICLLYTSPSPRDRTRSRMPSSA